MASERLEAAIAAFRNGCSLRGAAQAYDIPYATLWDKLNGRRKMVPEPRTVLKPEEESQLVDWLLKMSLAGFGRTKTDLFHKVKELLDSKNRTTI